MNKKLRFGLIGAGRIGPVHAETLAFRVPDAHLAAIADLNPKAAQAVASRCNIPKIVSAGTEVIADPEIDAVVICSPTDTHADLIVAAAKAGKHVFCEKPISLSLREIDRSHLSCRGNLCAIGFMYCSSDCWSAAETDQVEGTGATGARRALAAARRRSSCHTYTARRRE